MSTFEEMKPDLVNMSLEMHTIIPYLLTVGRLYKKCDKKLRGKDRTDEEAVIYEGLLEIFPTIVLQCVEDPERAAKEGIAIFNLYDHNDFCWAPESADTAAEKLIGKAKMLYDMLIELGLTPFVAEDETALAGPLPLRTQDKAPRIKRRIRAFFYFHKKLFYNFQNSVEIYHLHFTLRSFLYLNLIIPHRLVTNNNSYWTAY